jgi:tetratricopeptide (TPR) repeat protein
MRVRHTPRRRFGVAALFGALLLGACAYSIPEVDPADIPRLEEQVAANPSNTDLKVQLGMARFKAEDYEQARTLLQAAVDSGNQSGAALLYLGMSQEEFENWPAARDAYNTYLDVGRSEPLKQELRNRLQLIGQRVLRQQAQQALAREEELDASEVTPRSVAVLPFGFNSDREDLQPLIYALSDMMITDFAVSNALTVLERARIQTLLDEMALTDAGYAEAETGARAGRLLGAENVVQGVLTTLGQENLRLDTEVLNIPRSASEGSVEAEDALANLFDMEKDLVFRTLREVLGVELTPAEEQAILDNRAQNVLAFLAYGRGLRARDQGDYDAALQQFQQAEQLDPSFDAAGEAANETSGLQDASGTSTDDMAQTAATTGETGGGPVSPPPPDVTGAVPEGTGTPTANTDDVGSTANDADDAVNSNPTTGTLGAPTTTSTPSGSTGEERDPVQESQNQDGVTKATTAQIRIVIKAPGGGEE